MAKPMNNNLSGMNIRQTTDLISILDRQLMLENAQRELERGDRKYFYASDGLTYQYGGKCPRALCYEFLKTKLGVEPEPINVKTLRTFFIGEVFHESVQKLAINSGMADAVEEFTISKVVLPDNNILYIKREDKSNRLVFTYHNIEIHGRIDIRLNLPNIRVIDSSNSSMSYTKYVVDIKSIKSKSFLELTEPKLSHLLQVQLYLAATGIKDGMLLYISKNCDLDSDNEDLFKEYSFNYDPNFVATHLVYYQQLKLGYIDQGSLPDRPYRKEGIFCKKYCKWHKPCWGKLS